MLKPTGHKGAPRNSLVQEKKILALEGDQGQDEAREEGRRGRVVCRLHGSIRTDRKTAKARHQEEVEEKDR